MPTVNPQPAECPHCLEKPLGRSCFQHRGQCAELPQTSIERGVRWATLASLSASRRPRRGTQVLARARLGCQPCLPLWPASRKTHDVPGPPGVARGRAGCCPFWGLSAHTPKMSHLGQRGLDCTEVVPGQKPALHSGNLCAPLWVWSRRPI